MLQHAVERRPLSHISRASAPPSFFCPCKTPREEDPLSFPPCPPSGLTRIRIGIEWPHCVAGGFPISSSPNEMASPKKDKVTELRAKLNLDPKMLTGGQPSRPPQRPVEPAFAPDQPGGALLSIPLGSTRAYSTPTVLAPLENQRRCAREGVSDVISASRDRLNKRLIQATGRMCLNTRRCRDL